MLKMGAKPHKGVLLYGPPGCRLAPGPSSATAPLRRTPASSSLT